MFSKFANKFLLIVMLFFVVLLSDFAQAMNKMSGVNAERVKKKIEKLKIARFKKDIERVLDKIRETKKGAFELDTKIDRSVLLGVAIFHGDLNVVKKLLKIVPISELSRRGTDTPLHIAVKLEKLDIVKLLVSYGVDIAIENEKKQKPIDIAKDPAINYYLQMVTDFYVVVNKKKQIDFELFSFMYLYDDDVESVLSDLSLLLPMGTKKIADKLYRWIKDNDVVQGEEGPDIRLLYLRCAKKAPSFEAKQMWLQCCYEQCKPNDKADIFKDRVELYVQSLKNKKNDDSVFENRV